MVKRFTKSFAKRAFSPKTGRMLRTAATVTRIKVFGPNLSEISRLERFTSRRLGLLSMSRQVGASHDWFKLRGRSVTGLGRSGAYARIASRVSPRVRGAFAPGHRFFGNQYVKLGSLRRLGKAGNVRLAGRGVVGLTKRVGRFLV